MDLLGEMGTELPEKTAPESVRDPVLDEPKEEDINIDGLIQLTGGNDDIKTHEDAVLRS